jgi:hypothetical protein
VSIENLLDGEQQAEVVGLVMMMRAGFSRLADIMEEATAKPEASEGDRQRASLARQMVTAIDWQMMFPTFDGERAEEWGREMLTKIFNGPVPSMPRLTPPPAPKEQPRGDDEEWSEELK